MGSALAGGGASAKLLSPWVVFEVALCWLQAANAETAQVSAKRRRLGEACDMRLSLVMTMKFPAVSFVPKMCLVRSVPDMNAIRTNAYLAVGPEHFPPKWLRFGEEKALALSAKG
jgi:hypothetical protein